MTKTPIGDPIDPPKKLEKGFCELSSGNVFKDLDLQHPELHKLVADIVMNYMKSYNLRELSQSLKELMEWTRSDEDRIYARLNQLKTTIEELSGKPFKWR